MEIINFESLITDRDKVYEVEGRYYHRCCKCGSIHVIDYHKTKDDIANAKPGDEESFCDSDCERAFYYDGGD